MNEIQSITIGSMACKLRHSYQYKSKFIPSGMRKSITTFSKTSKRNMLWRIQTIDYEVLRNNNWSCYFITLTYQRDFYKKYKNNKIAKFDLDKFFKRIKTYFKRNKIELFTVWKMEYHKSGVPHFHLMLYLSDKNFRYERLINIIPEIWVNVIIYGNKCSKKLKRKMLNASTNIRYVNLEFEQIIQAYMSKEIGKEIQTEQINKEDHPGRFWGIDNRKVYKRYLKEDNKIISKRVYFMLRRALKKLNKSKGYDFKIRGLNGFTSYYMNTKDVKRLLCYYEELCNEIPA